ATPKSAQSRTLAGQPVQRLDIPDKVLARPRFIHDLALPGLLHGRVLRPGISGQELTGLVEDSARAVPGLVAIVRDRNFVGIGSEPANGAGAAREAWSKHAAWSAGETLPDKSDRANFLKPHPAETTTTEKRAAPPPSKIAPTTRRKYPRPYVAHA